MIVKYYIINHIDYIIIRDVHTSYFMKSSIENICETSYVDHVSYTI